MVTLRFTLVYFVKVNTEFGTAKVGIVDTLEKNWLNQFQSLTRGG